MRRRYARVPAASTPRAGIPFAARVPLVAPALASAAHAKTLRVNQVERKQSPDGVFVFRATCIAVARG